MNIEAKIKEIETLIARYNDEDFIVYPEHRKLRIKNTKDQREIEEILNKLVTDGKITKEKADSIWSKKIADYMGVIRVFQEHDVDEYFDVERFFANFTFVSIGHPADTIFDNLLQIYLIHHKADRLEIEFLFGKCTTKAEKDGEQLPSLKFIGDLVGHMIAVTIDRIGENYIQYRDKDGKWDLKFHIDLDVPINGKTNTSVIVKKELKKMET